MEINWFKSEIVSLRQKLYSYALKAMDDEEDAEDIVQETFLKLWNHREKLKTIENPEGFAMQTCKNTCIDALRLRKNRVDADDFHLGAENFTPYTYSEQKNAVDLVRQIIEQLPGLQRTIIEMRDVEDYELDKIAAITGTQVPTVRVNLSRARKRVRDEFIRINQFGQRTKK